MNATLPDVSGLPGIGGAPAAQVLCASPDYGGFVAVMFILSAMATGTLAFKNGAGVRSGLIICQFMVAAGFLAIQIFGG